VLDLDTMKAWLDLQETDTDHDAVLIALERSIVAYVQRQTSRYFGLPETFTEQLDGSGTDTVWLRDEPQDLDVSPVTATVDGTAVSSTITVIGRQAILDEGIWPIGRGNLLVTYERGYLAGDEPADIRQAVLELVETSWRGRVAATPVTAFEIPVVETRTVKATFAAWRGGVVV
jgi:hypothetical protein